MKQKLNLFSSIFSLSGLHFLDRGASFLLMSLVTLNIETQQVTGDFEWLTPTSLQMGFLVLCTVLPLPLGLLSDFSLGARQSILWGAILSLVGFFLILPGEEYLLIGGFVLVSIGSSLVQTNLIVQLGRLFEKEDRQRNWAFLVFYFAGTLLSFFITLGVLNWWDSSNTNFTIFACIILSSIYTALAFFLQDRLEEKEKPFEFDQVMVPEDDRVLDLLTPDTTAVDLRNNLRNLLILIFIVNLVYLFSHSKGNQELVGLFLNYEGDMSLQMRGFLYAVDTYLILAFSLFFGIWWYVKKSGSTWYKLAGVLFLMAFGWLLLFFAQPISDAYFFPMYFLIVVIFSLANFLAGVLFPAYLTRISPRKYSATLVAAFSFLSTFTFWAYSTPSVLLIGLCILLGIVALLLPQWLRHTSKNLD